MVEQSSDSQTFFIVIFPLTSPTSMSRLIDKWISHSHLDMAMVSWEAVVTPHNNNKHWLMSPPHHSSNKVTLI